MDIKDMDIKDFLKMLNAEALNEEQQKAIATKLEDIIDLKVKEKLDEALTEEKEILTESYETKFEDYKNDITTKFSNFVDSILEEELVIPDNIIEYARKGELYSELIEQFKIRLGIDEGILEDGVKDLLKEAKDEIEKLQQEVNELHNVKLTLEKDAQEFASELYKREKCDGLTESQKEKVLTLLEGITDKTMIDRKFDLLVESTLNEEETNDCVCPKCGKTSSVKGACNMSDCPDCNVKMEKAGKVEEGKGQAVVDVVKPLNEDDKSPFELAKQKYVQILRDKRF